MIKRSIHQEDRTIINIYMPNIREPKNIQQKLAELKEEIKSNTILVWDFNTHAKQWRDYSERE